MCVARPSWTTTYPGPLPQQGSHAAYALARTLDIYRRTEGQWVLAHSFSGEEMVRAEPFEAIEFELPLLWSE